LENSAQPVRSVLGAFAVPPGGLPAGPVLLIDDVVDSGWTLTVIAATLREAGSGPVYPFVLAKALGG
jgi:ATP-dependent DNA helicase RecQ